MRPTNGDQPHGSDRQLDEATTPAGPDVRHAVPAQHPQASDTAEPTLKAKPKPQRRSWLSRTSHANRPYYFKRSNATQWLLAVFLLAMIGAFLLYPSRAPIYRPPPLSMQILLLNATAVSEVTYNVSPASPNAFAMTLQFHFSRARSSTTSPRPAAEMRMSLPTGVIPESCHHANGDEMAPPPPGQCAYTSNKYQGGSLVLVANAKEDLPSPGRYWTDILNLRLKSQGPWNTNGLTVEAQLPVLKVYTTLNGVSTPTPLPLNDNPITYVSYRVPDAISYDWSGGPPPNSVSNSDGAEWDEPLQSLSVPIAVGGTNSSSASLDSLRTLAAGTLLGVAGGALVGAIQEFTHRKSEALPLQPTPSQPG